MKKSELNLNILKKSLSTLKECYEDLNAQEDEKIKNYIKDSCVQRFEYTYETAKKIDLTINNIFREMFALGLIESFENWVDYREKRNITSHEYNIELTYPIIDIIPKFTADVDFLIKSFEKVLTND